MRHKLLGGCSPASLKRNQSNPGRAFQEGASRGLTSKEEQELGRPVTVWESPYGSHYGDHAERTPWPTSQRAATTNKRARVRYVDRNQSLHGLHAVKVFPGDLASADILSGGSFPARRQMIHASSAERTREMEESQAKQPTGKARPQKSAATAAAEATGRKSGLIT